MKLQGKHCRLWLKSLHFNLFIFKVLFEQTFHRQTLQQKFNCIILNLDEARCCFRIISVESLAFTNQSKNIADFCDEELKKLRKLNDLEVKHNALVVCPLPHGVSEKQTTSIIFIGFPDNNLLGI